MTSHHGAVFSRKWQHNWNYFGSDWPGLSPEALKMADLSRAFQSPKIFVKFPPANP
jgi:hypothetical protein